MPGWLEIKSSLYGAYRIARLDAGGLAHFNVSVEGFWRSFFAAIVVAPAYVLLLLVRNAALQNQLSDTGPMPTEISFAPEFITYVIGWITWPLIMLLVARLLSRTENFVPYIIVYNWANCIQVGLLLPVAVLTQGSVFPPEIAAIIGVVVTGLVLFYLWFIARMVLAVQGWAAAGIVIIDILLGVLTANLINRLFV